MLLVAFRPLHPRPALRRAADEGEGETKDNYYYEQENDHGEKTTTAKKKATTPQLDFTPSQAIDLGLSVKWAEWNVGASSPEQAGGYYAWGELSPKSNYNKSTYKYYNGNSYVDIGDDISGNVSYDVARAQWGGSWRMPTKAEIDELLNRCTWKWTTYRGVKGCKVTGPNGNYIFLPAAGDWRDTSVICAGSYGYGEYWSSTRYTKGTDNDNDIYKLYFGSDFHSVYVVSRRYGQSVRPVSD